MVYPNVVIYDKSILGKDVIVHGGTVIGSDGFGYEFDGSKHQKIIHFGYVKIEDDVEIGANCTIDRGRSVKLKLVRVLKLITCVRWVIT